VLTPRALKGFGMYMKAKELADKNGWFLARQFETEANADIHASTTAREILADFAGERLDYFVTGYGTGGTVSGSEQRSNFESEGGHAATPRACR
jgi:cysteine synthase